MSTLKIQSLVKNFKTTQVLRGLDLEVATGEFISLLGPSGCGKTTLLRCIAGLETVTSGSIHIGDENVTNLPPEKRHLGMMFQSYALFPHMSVLENVRFGLRMEKKQSTKEQYDIAQNALERVQMGHLAKRMPTELSGGQQQRVALARAIATGPRLLLLDEPLSNLDARLREDMQIELKELHQSLGVTTIFVTHDQEEALSLSDRIVLMNAGVIEQVATPSEIYSAPATPFAADFIGAANLVPAQREGKMARLQGTDITIETAESGSGEGFIMLRQEDISVSTSPSTTTPFSATLHTSVYRGADAVHVIELGDHRLKVVTSRAQSTLEAGPVSIGWHPDAPVWIKAP